jgi:broad specificity phosphatase PhoE
MTSRAPRRNSNGQQQLRPKILGLSSLFRRTGTKSEQQQQEEPDSSQSRCTKKRRSLSPGREGATSFLPEYICGGDDNHDDDEVDPSSNFVFDDTFHENEPECHPLPSLPRPQQQQEQQQRSVVTATAENDYEFNIDDMRTPNLTRSNNSEYREIILYLVRHGEAAHNIKEKEAKTRAKRMSVAEGFTEDHPVTLARMEHARKSVLNDETLRDAPLSGKGREEAQQAHEKLQQILSEHPEFPSPSYVMVSPLTRTLETCDIIFPQHDEIHVRTSIAERHTLKPPDTRSHVSQLSKRKSFQHFSMEQLRAESMTDIQDHLERSQHNSNNIGATSSSSQAVLVIEEEGRDVDNKWNWTEDQWKEEDKAELRRRTERIFVLLAEANSASVALVTHKGYLRELERGPFGSPNATEFQNGEIRIYKVTVSMTELKSIRSERLM